MKVLRITCIICITAILFNLFTACSGTEKPLQSTQASAAGQTADLQTEAKKDVSLRMSWWGGEARHKATLEALDLYMSKNPNVKVETEYSGWDGYYEKLLTQLAGQAAPDLIQIDFAWVAEMKSDTVFANLKDFSGIVDLSTFDEKMLNDYMVLNGKTIGLPTGLNGTIIAYNKDLLDANGIAIDPNWDWDKMLEMGKQLYAKNSNCTFLLAEISGFNEFMTSYLRQRTGDHFINDDYTIASSKQDIIDMFTMIKTMVDEHIMVPFEETALIEGKAQEYAKWVKGEIGCTPTGPSYYGEFAKTTSSKLATVVIPRFKDAKISGAPVRPTNIFSVNLNSEIKEESVKLLDWLLNDKEAALKLGTVRSVPASSSARQALIDAKMIDPEVNNAVENLLKNNCSPANALEVNEEINATILNDLIQQVGFKKLTPEQAADAYFTKLEAKLAELKSSAQK